MVPNGGSDISLYSAADLPAGLVINGGSGDITGQPTAANATTAAVTVTVTDTAGNTATTTVTFPAVAKGDQTLSGFAYSVSALTFGSATTPAVTPPSGAVTTLSYSAAPAAVCTVNAATGDLTILGVGECVVTVTAAANDDYNEGTATYTVTVQAAGILVLNLDDIAEDNTVNVAEKAAGFAITGDTGTEAGVAVTVTVGATALTATSADPDGDGRGHDRYLVGERAGPRRATSRVRA